MLWLLVATAFAADNATLRAGLEDPKGWVELERKQVDVGEILIRHKVIGGTDCLEGSTSAQANPEVLLRLASDIPGQIKWSRNAVQASITMSDKADKVDYYQVLDTPVIADRYWFLRGTRVHDGDRLMFSWEPLDAASLYPTELAFVKTHFPGAVEPDVNIGDWTFQPQGGSTMVRYRICTNAGGSIPDYLGKLAALRALPTNIEDIIKAALGIPRQ